jgi:hypothetical protein
MQFSFKYILKKFHELYDLIRGIHQTVQNINIIDKELLKDDFDNNLIVIADPIDRFITKNMQYQRNKKVEDTNKRLFITTGGISLITVLSIRKKMGSNNCEDYLIILGSNDNNPVFIDCNTNIAELSDFKKIIFLMQRPVNYRLLITFGLEEIDEIVMVANLYFYSCFTTLYPNIKYTLFEEGPGTISYPVYDYSKINKVIVHNYIGKFEYFIWHKTKINPTVEFVDEIIFNDILKDIRNKLNIVFDLDGNTKYILLCGPNLELKYHITANVINNLINKLVKQGYKVLFKKHPRDTDSYVFGDNVININTTYPIELYNLNIVAAVDFGSSVCITMPYFNKTAVFSDMPKYRYKSIDIPYMTVLLSFIIKQYTMPIKVLLDFDHKRYTPVELKNKFMEISNNNMDKIPRVSDNINIIKFLDRNRKRLEKLRMPEF